MSDRPMIFTSTVPALIAGTKTQTRRALPRLPRFGKISEFGRSDTRGYDWHFRDREARWQDLRDVDLMKALPYAVGDRLWVREAYYLTDNGHGEFAIYAADEDKAREHLADVEKMRADRRYDQVFKNHARLRPSIHLPRWASRITLIVTDVLVQRLQEISEEDAMAEGVKPASGKHREPHVATFADLWSELHGSTSWAENPWVAAISFRTILANIDAPEAHAA